MKKREVIQQQQEMIDSLQDCMIDVICYKDFARNIKKKDKKKFKKSKKILRLNRRIVELGNNLIKEIE